MMEDAHVTFLLHLNRALCFAFPLIVDLSPKSILGNTLMHKHHWINFESIKSDIKNVQR